MRAASWIVAVALATVGCSAAVDKPAPVPPAASGAGPAAGQVEMKKVAASANYPLTTCVVSGKPLGAIADRIAYTYDGTEVQFCCPGCVKDFKKDPAPYLAKIASAAK